MIIHQAAHIAKHIVGQKLSKVFLPNYAVFVITKRCNMSCAMCGVDKQNGENDMDISGYQKFFNTGLKRLDVVKITGGEPFIRKDAKEIMALILEESKTNIFHITTNGYYTERIRDFLKLIGNRKIGMSVSIDGDEKTHNMIRGRPDAFQRAIDTLKMIKKDHKNVKLTINCTISSYNYKEFFNLKDFLERLNIKRIAYFIADSNKNYDDPLDLKSVGLIKNSMVKGLSPDEREKICSVVESNNSKQGITYRLLNRYYITGLRSRIKNGKTNSRRKHHCMAIWSYFRVEPNGDIIMCITRPEVVGNILKMGFNDIWFGKRAQEIRQIVKSCSECWKECEVIPSCVYSGDLIRFFLLRN